MEMWKLIEFINVKVIFSIEIQMFSYVHKITGKNITITQQYKMQQQFLQHILS